MTSDMPFDSQTYHGGSDWATCWKLSVGLSCAELMAKENLDYVTVTVPSDRHCEGNEDGSVPREMTKQQTRWSFWEGQV